MDVISFAANVIAVLGAASKLARGLESLRSFKGAPYQLLQVINEVSDIRTVLTIVHQTCAELEDIDKTQTICAKLRELLLDAEIHFEVMYEISARILDTQDRTAGQSKISWRLWMREKKNVQIHSNALRDIKRKITELLAALQISNIPKVHVRMTEIAIRQNETREQADLIMNHVLAIHSQQKDLQARLQSLQLTASELSQRKPAPKESSSVVHIPASIHRQQACNMFCACRCHKRTTFTSPSWMQQLVGTLFIGYKAIPSLRPVTCNERMCTQRQNQLIDVNYYFPLWLLERAVFFRSRYSPTDGCMISVRTPRMVSHSAPQILLCSQGRVDELKEMFKQGLASPFDVDATGGSSCLQYAVELEHVELSRFLLSEYADPSHCDKRSMSCLNCVWIKDKLRKDWSPAMAEIKYLLRDFLEDYDTQELCFTIPHQILFGTAGVSLETHLLLTTAGIDTGCSQGRTPLMWAVAMSDLKAIQTLLEFGASINLSDSIGRNVFHIAVWEGSVEAMGLLFDSVIASHETSGPLRRLIDQPDIYGFTPLCCAILHGRTAHASLLFQVPYTINPSYPIIHPILPAVQTNRHEMLKHLLKSGARMDCKDSDDQTVLHIAACYSDLETILILLDDPPWNAGVTDADVYGNTPMRCFEAIRATYVNEDAKILAESREAFESLLNKINAYQLQL